MKTKQTNIHNSNSDNSDKQCHNLNNIT